MSFPCSWTVILFIQNKDSILKLFNIQFLIFKTFMCHQMCCYIPPCECDLESTCQTEITYGQLKIMMHDFQTYHTISHKHKKAIYLMHVKNRVKS